MTCPECEAQMLAHGRFCHYCGWDSKLAAAGRASSTASSRPTWKRVVMAITLGLAALLVAWLLLVPREDAQASLAVGDPAPAFDLETLDGQRVRLADLQGKPLILNFWASWCGPCREEMPHFQAIYNAYKDQGLQLYGVNLGESRVAVRDFMNRVGVEFPVLLDLEEKAQADYRILPIPATFFIDAQGTIRAVYQYQMSPVQIQAEVQRLLDS